MRYSPAPKDIFFMKEALRLAERGRGFVHPNPLVGAVVVKNGKIIGRGFHKKFGGPHAEVNAILNASADVGGATLYVTLEPCTHFGKTPPCVDLVIKNKIKRVIVGAQDPNPLVSGKGFARLRKAGIEVAIGVLEKETLDLNRDFNHWIVKQHPYVTIKAAESLDGKIATRTGQSRWITGESARSFSHELRAVNDAILVGVNTILRDDPLLNVRLKKNIPGPQPIRIVLDSKLKTPLNARIFSSKSGGKVIIATTSAASKKRINSLQKKAEIIICKTAGGRIDLSWLMKVLAKKGIVSILVEGGGEVIADFLNKKLAKEIYFFIAPMIIGGRKAIGSVGGEGIKNIKDAMQLKEVDVERFSKDILIHGVI